MQKNQGIDPLETLYRQNDVLAHDPVSMEEMKKQFEKYFQRILLKIYH